MNDGLERIRKEEVITYSRCYPGIWLERLRENGNILYLEKPVFLPSFGVPPEYGSTALQLHQLGRSNSAIT
jgi:hypothetical protein